MNNAGSTNNGIISKDDKGMYGVRYNDLIAPVVKSIPYLNKPEEITPGNPLYYASTYFSENTYASLLVKTREGRPILLSSNNNPTFGGGINARCQASVLSLYDSNRLKGPLKNTQETTWDVLDKEVINALDTTSKDIVILTSTIISPSNKELLKEFKNKFKNVKVVSYDAVSKDSILSANDKTWMLYIKLNTIQ